MKKFFTAWVYGTIGAAFGLWLLPSALFRPYVIFPLPSQAVDMGSAYAPLAAKYDLLLILTVMIGGAVFSVPIFFVLKRRAKKA